ncbi:hypothetical protein BSKO_04534 [Bryopsis sp. KO-2023]|nr:hypothetical protein BSKO_04534 [Bryopsis sp. KO-2023]
MSFCPSAQLRNLCAQVVCASADRGTDWWASDSGFSDVFDSWSTPSHIASVVSKSSSKSSSNSQASASTLAVSRGGGSAKSTSSAEANGNAKAKADSEAIAENGKDAYAKADAQAAASKGGSNAADARVKVKSTGGSAEGTAFAFAETLTEVENAVAKAVNSAVTEVSDPRNKEPLTAIANSTAIAIGRIMVEAYATAGVSLKVEGSGSAEGTADAFAEDIDQAVASAIASSFARVEDFFGSEATAEAYADGLVVAFAKARAVSRVKAKTFQGEAVAIQESTAMIIAQPIAVALSKGIAFVVGTEAFADSKSFSDTRVKDEDVNLLAEGETDVSGRGSFADAVGEASVDLDEVLPCESHAHTCCKRLKHSSHLKTCFCSRSRRGSKTCRFSLVKNSSGLKTWKDAKDDGLCYCANLLPV